MTEQLMDTLSNEEHERLLLMSEHGIAPSLSPAAQKISDVYQNNLSSYMETGLIAALRALANQVAPSDAAEPRNSLPMAIECQRIRSEILAIAAELEG